MKDGCCVFPYVYGDIEYHTCTDKDHSTFWCATKVAADLTYLEVKNCDDACGVGK